MIFEMYVLPWRRETAAQTKRYLGLLIALMIAVWEELGFIPNKSRYPSMGSLMKRFSGDNSMR